MKNDLLAYRHIGISEKDEEKMLQKIGVKSLDELIDKTIPANIRLKEPLALPPALFCPHPDFCTVKPRFCILSR